MHAHQHRDGPPLLSPNGYVEDGPPVGEFGTSSGYPMSKLLALQKP